MIGQIPESNAREKLVDQWRTRWVARHDSFNVFCKLYTVVIAFEEILSQSNHHNWNDTVIATNSLKVAITQWKFLIAFVVAKKGLE